ncbi:VOC family protein [Amycolatopsis sp. NPDC049252]|uniref:VOC family protein n=1 Tax=Amycolatopsis sp. NPDC049252 TaxID=3363933 RepID=UPI0037239EC4
MTDMKLEIAVLPVSDVDRAKNFYKALGWREDADFPGEGGFRVVQLTPPGSPASVIFGSRITDAAPGSAQGLHLVVTDIEAARAEIAAQGVAISEVFHDAGGVFHHAGTEGRVSGPDPDHTSYASFASFSDPDGNGWVLQEITTRLPGRVTDVTFSSAAELADALRQAAAAHGEHEKELGHEDADWPSWYAEYLVRHGRSGA